MHRDRQAPNVGLATAAWLALAFAATLVVLGQNGRGGSIPDLKPLAPPAPTSTAHSSSSGSLPYVVLP